MKRLTDTTIWDKEWFMALEPKYKCAIMYIKDKCDNVGVWSPNYSLADYIIGDKIDWDKLIELSNGNIEIMNNKLRIVDFCDFQYGKLNDKCKPHQSYIKLLHKHGIHEKVVDSVYVDKDLEKDIMIRGKNDTIRRLYDHNNWHNTIIKNNNLDPLIFKNYLTMFIKEQDSKDMLYRPIKELKSHFVSWLNIQLKKQI